MEFYIGQIFEGTYPPEASNWCNANNATIVELDSGECQIVAIPEPTVEEKNAQIKQIRSSLYSQLIDPLHAEKQRKTITGEWTEADEAEYVARVKELSEKIREENPYVE